MEIKGLLFDLDGTLANTLPLCIKVYQHTLKKFTGRDFSEQEVTEHFGITEEGIFRRVVPDQWEAALACYNDVYEELHEECPAPFEDIVAMLELLKQRGVAMAVVTGKGPYTARFTLDYLGIAHYFDQVEAGDAYALIKSAAMRKILAKWQMEPRHAAYIGDSASDIEEATAAGVLPLGACWAATSTIHQLDSMEPFATFSSVKRFIHWLDDTITPANGRV